MHLTLSTSPRSRIRRRLWKLGVAIALMLATFAVGNAVISPDRAVGKSMLGHDFLPFYSAGYFTRTDQFDRLYDLDSIKAYEAEIEQSHGLQVGSGFGPFWNPPFAALAIAPLSQLDYRDALSIWLITGGLFLALSIAVLIKLLGARSWKSAGLVPLFILASMPTVQAFSHGQNTFITLGLLIGVAVLWRNDMGLAAGMVAGLLFYKPQHAAVIAAVLCLSMGRKPVLGLATTLCTLLVINLCSMPGTLEAFALKLPANLHQMQDLAPYMWERHATLKAFWRLLLQGGAAGEISPMVHIAWLVSVALFATPLALAAWREGGSQWIGGFRDLLAHDYRRDRLIAATIATAPLIMPFSFDYDLLLLAIPAVLWAKELMQQRTARLATVDRVCMTGWVGLYLWTFVNPIVAKPLRVDGTVIWLSLIAGSLIVRSLRPMSQAVPMVDDSDLVGPLLSQAA